ncbi:hypothetical protein LC724_33545 [Blautia sp. RD014234]|nr:hypothetical protein [Blautia parvula]
MANNKVLQPKKRTLFLYMFPSVVLFLVFTAIPIIMAIYYSLFNWSGGKKKIFLGLGNYSRLLGIPSLEKHCSITLFWQPAVWFFK